MPAIEELIIITRGLILLEGEDEFMFACAHCCLGIMESTFRHGSDWAFVLVISLKLTPRNLLTFCCVSCKKY